ncbi:trans-Golgi network integral membrane protein 2 [Sceloporus undulatus]|uniref:trans-Golgi network integral membrane protein 2 n=1 Tax=Sceloporus undulatus TaxID=8520 RepID=UPI001C4BD990|nr:trans-Golgi network integral membrane protein 2 [Sceloporus undulatus]
MAGAGLCFFVFVLFAVLLQFAAFGAPAPSGSGGVHEQNPSAEGDQDRKDLKPPGDPSALTKTESTQPQSGATSIDSSHAEGKDSKNLATKTKNLDLPVSNSLVKNTDLKDPKNSENLQAKPQSAHVPDSSPEKLKLEDSENLAPATESSQPHTSISDPATQKPGRNEAKQSGSLPGESNGVKSVTSLPESPPLISDPKETKEAENLSPSTENDPAPPHNSDHNEAKQNEKLPEESKTHQSDGSLVDPAPRKPDHNEDNQSEKVPEKSKNPQSDKSVADSHSSKSDQNEASQNEKTPHSGAAGAESTSQKSDHNEPNEKDSVPVVPENDLSDTSIPKDDDVDDDSMRDDETIGGGKEGEETAETAQSEKEEVKNSPVGPPPKNGSENSHFFAYLVTTAIVVAALYIAYHNKRKIIAFALEGKKSKVIRRPKSSDYQRLDQKI